MSVTLHTTCGDIKLELFCEDCPKTCENFLALCASGYYKDNVFHRNIKDFMVQTGDPTGTGKGGQSCWGAPFDDELVPQLRHDCRGTVAMANNGANTNKSQFYITYAKVPHLDLKYTVFARVIDGFDALEELETIKVDAKYRPVVEQRTSQFMQILSPPNATKYLLRYNSSAPLTAEERIKQMQDYFNQYVEEYYEVDESKEEVIEDQSSQVEEVKVVETLDDVVELLQSERARDMVVLDLGEAGPGPITKMIICSPFNARHGFAVAESLRKAARVEQPSSQTSKRSVRDSHGWFHVDVNDIQVHVMSEELRERFDLESLWGCGEEPVEEDEIPLIPPPRKFT